MLILSALLGVVDNVNATVALFPVNWSLTTVVPVAVAATVISVADVCVNVIPEPSVKFTAESEPVAASNCKGTLLPAFAPACKVYVSPVAVDAIEISLALTLVKAISVPAVSVIASFVASLPAKLMFVVAVGTSIV